MINTTPEYKIAIEQGNRNTVVRISFGVFDVTAREDATPSANTSSSFTSILSVVDDKRAKDYKPMTFEDDYSRLDGSFVLFPDDPEPDGTELGWWSAYQSNNLGVFTIPPVIEIDFVSNHSSLGIGLVFDDTNVFHCKEFKIQWYDGVTLLNEALVENNTLSFINVETAVENYNRVVITLYKTDYPYRYARLLEVNFGLEELFTNDLIVGAELIEESSPITKELSMNKLKFTVINENQKFNMINPDGVYSFLQRRQPITAFSGLQVGASIEYVPMGIYYLSSWKNSSGLTATLEATDIVGVLDKTIYYSSPFFVNEPLINVLEDIISDAGIVFDVTIQSGIVEVVNGYIPIASHREAIQTVLMACRCAVRYNRSYGFEVYRPDYSTSLKEIDFEVILGDAQIEQLELITSVEAEKNTYELASVAEIIHESSFEVIGEQSIIIPYDKAPSAQVNVSVSGLGIIVGLPVYSVTCVRLVINGTGIVNVEVTGKPYSISKQVVVSTLSTIPAGETPQSAELADNPLFVGNTKAVTEYVLEYYQKRIKQRIDYWADPSLQAGDNVNVETMFGQTKSGIIERQVITFSPSLKTDMEVIG